MCPTAENDNIVAMVAEAERCQIKHEHPNLNPSSHEEQLCAELRTMKTTTFADEEHAINSYAMQHCRAGSFMCLDGDQQQEKRVALTNAIPS